MAIHRGACAMTEESDENEYAVGYGKPPKEYQFKPGQSGNPKGRPPDKRNMKRALRDVLTEDIEVVDNGQRVTISKQDALMRMLVAKALKGDRHAYRMVIELSAKPPYWFRQHGD